VLGSIRSELMLHYGIDHVTLQPETDAGWVRPEPLRPMPKPRDQ